jgi:phosphoserine aminotransferase
MTQIAKPAARPVNSNFSSGPCAKRPGWSLEALKGAFLGRSHRAAEGKTRLKAIIEEHRRLLEIPADYKIGIVAASDTGAIEMALWSMLGERGVDVFSWEQFSSDWLKDVVEQLKLPDVRQFKAPYGELPDMKQADSDRDIVFVWNGTTSGVRIPNYDWIKSERKGLTFCDATSAVFAYEMDWTKLDITTWSWQKVLGGEAAHGMIVLSPRAIERLEKYQPDRALPKIFRMTNKGKLIDGVFEGETINTPSMLAVEDCADALRWVESIGGLKATIKRSSANFDVINEWVKKTDWIDFLPADEAARSRTSICLKIVDPDIQGLDEDALQAFVKEVVKKLDKEGVAHDIASYKTAPAGFRIWGGATIEASDVAILTQWMDWAYFETKAALTSKAA